MSDFPSRDGDERETTPPVISSQSSPKASFWVRELPYTAVFILAIFGIAYNSYSKQSIVGYWQFLALLICMCALVLVGHMHARSLFAASSHSPRPNHGGITATFARAGFLLVSFKESPRALF